VSQNTPVSAAVPASGSVNGPAAVAGAVWPTAAGAQVPLAGYASRRLSTQNVTASRMAASITKMPVSMPWKAQNLLAGW
jgi:hypothetical protein